jgi:hypothetical protein
MKTYILSFSHVERNLSKLYRKKIVGKYEIKILCLMKCFRILAVLEIMKQKWTNAPELLCCVFIFYSVLAVKSIV